MIDPITAFLNGPQRVIYDEAQRLLTTESSNLAYLPAGSDKAVQDLLADPQPFRGNKMAQLKRATDDLATQIQRVVARKRDEITQIVKVRDAELRRTADYIKASTEAQEEVSQRIATNLERIAQASQAAVIDQIGMAFEADGYPALLDLLAAASSNDVGDMPPAKQTVSVKTIAVPTRLGVLETEGDVDRYLDDLRSVLVRILSDGKRIAL